MCTVSYLPTKDGFFLTSNRDEAPGRNTRVIETTVLDHGVRAMYPKDEQSTGSWIACGDNGRVVCLLNGAFEAHVRQLPYKMSRGLVVLFAIQARSMDVFVSTYEFDGIEPFTLISIQDDQLIECVWDGSKKFLKEYSPYGAYLWSSSTLYNPKYRKKRLETV